MKIVFSIINIGKLKDDDVKKVAEMDSVPPWIQRTCTMKSIGRL